MTEVENGLSVCVFLGGVRAPKTVIKIVPLAGFQKWASYIANSAQKTALLVCWLFVCTCVMLNAEWLCLAGVHVCVYSKLQCDLSASWGKVCSNRLMRLHSMCT